jgi:alkylmercury lyase-like protein
VIDDQGLRQHVYAVTVERGRPPLAADVATALGVSATEVLDGFQRLRAKRLLYLARDTGEVVMAPPFAAAPTTFLVAARGRTYFANCVWDAYGIAAALGSDAAIDASCGCCGEPMALAVEGNRPVATPGVGHFAVPAAHWWDDLPYT